MLFRSALNAQRERGPVLLGSCLSPSSTKAALLPPCQRHAPMNPMPSRRQPSNPLRVQASLHWNAICVEWRRRSKEIETCAWLRQRLAPKDHNPRPAMDANPNVQFCLQGLDASTLRSHLQSHMVCPHQLLGQVGSIENSTDIESTNMESSDARMERRYTPEQGHRSPMPDGGALGQPKRTVKPRANRVST